MDTPAEKALKLRPSSVKYYGGNCPPSSTVTICSFSMQGYKSLKYHLFLFNAGIHVIEEAQAVLLQFCQFYIPTRNGNKKPIALDLYNPPSIKTLQNLTWIIVDAGAI